MTFSAWDRRLTARAAGLAGVTALVALLVIVTTDDGAPWARRAAMWGAVAPLAGAVGTLGALRLAEARGELRALFAVGARPSRARLGACAGGIALALAGPIAAASPWADLGALFPRPVELRVWTPGDAAETRAGGSPRAAMLETSMGIRVEPKGRITFLGGAGTPGAAPRPAGAGAGAISGHTAAWTIAVLALCAVACPIWVSVRSSALRKAFAGLAAIAALIAAFQAVALGRGAPLLLLGAPLLLLADVATPRYGARRDA